MSAMTTLDEAVGMPAPVPTSRRRRRPGRWALSFWSWLVILWLCAPIIVMIIFGFNDTTGRFNIHWQGFTLRWYRQLFAIHDLTQALETSLTIAVLVTVIATALGTLMGMALGKYRFRGAGSVNLLMFANIAAPEVVMGSALLSLFLTLGVPRGYWTIVTATFRLVTLPLIMPGVLAGALLTFALSIDDFIITSFNAGNTTTFPLWVYGASRLGIPPQVNVMGTLIFAFGVLLAVTGAVLNRRRA